MSELIKRFLFLSHFYVLTFINFLFLTFYTVCLATPNCNEPGFLNSLSTPSHSWIRNTTIVSFIVYCYPFRAPQIYRLHLRKHSMLLSAAIVCQRTAFNSIALRQRSLPSPLDTNRCAQRDNGITIVLTEISDVVASVDHSYWSRVLDDPI